MNRRTLDIFVAAGLKVKVARRCSMTGADPAVGCQETTGAGGEAEARNRRLFVGRDLRIGVGDLFEVGLKAADRRRSAGLYGPGLYRR